MAWQHRVRDLLLAGGTLTAVACSSSNDSTVFCCNANPDPCCASQHCGGAVTPACRCQMAGGTWDDSAGGGGVCGTSMDSGFPDSSFPDTGFGDSGSNDASVRDAAPADGDADAATRDANADVAHD